MTLLRMAVAALTLCIAGLATAQAPADFGGNWSLNTKKGENLGMVAALTETVVVTQSDAQMVIDYTDVFQGNTTTRQVNYDLGGAAVENFAAMGDPSKTASKWVGEDLVTTWTSEGAIAGTEVVRTETRALSDGGMIMTVTTARDDKPPMVLVYERQE